MKTTFNTIAKNSTIPIVLLEKLGADGFSLILFGTKIQRVLQEVY